ncbi:nitrate/nitrite transport system permease protein [Aeromonas sp. BIGb0405]|uniref:ABC transporter permease n=1 Tax=Aeromonas sp. BIGb0405 TaxID=2940592 RepID=UPI002168C956|nr:ABC transporter permease [Aeromonas sp. BIGb0405]MCS3454892.1 nitrate/nitrite transport system permease protein [Aeromonas sp. BIGb0405]
MMKATAIGRLLAPCFGIVLFLLCWQLGASQVKTSLGTLPGPGATASQLWQLGQEHLAERERESGFLARQASRNAERLAADPAASIKVRSYPGRATFFDQIGTSLLTVATGFGLATLLAVPLGIVLGIHPQLYRIANPVIQLLKPVSPLAWLPLITMVVSAVYVSPDPWLAKSFVNSALTVALCSLWPTLLNTAVGVSSVDPDLHNVSRVLRLPFLTHIAKIVLPSALPMIFTGMRLSLGVAWMVLIAAEMLAQNPGLGKFVWDEFQSGSSASLARIMVAVVTIGLIGFALDRLMLALQQWLSWDKRQLLR